MVCARSSFTDDELADALMAATRGPSRRPPKKKSAWLLVRRSAKKPIPKSANMYATKVMRMAMAAESMAGTYAERSEAHGPKFVFRA